MYKSIIVKFFFSLLSIIKIEISEFKNWTHQIHLYLKRNRNER